MQRERECSVKDSDPRIAANGTLQVRAFADHDCARWTNFVATCPDATFFHRIEWRDIIERVFGHRTHYLLAEQGGQITGVLPLAEVKSLLFGHSLVSLPFAVYGGAAVNDDHTRSVLHKAAAELALNLGVEYLEVRNRAPDERGWPQPSLFVTFRKPIEPSVEANMQAIPRKQRAMVRKGMQRGLTSEIDANVDRFFDLYADNMHRHGTPPYSKRYFEALQRVFGNDCELLIVVGPQGQAVSGVLSFYFRGEVLPYYAGDRVEARELAANDFKYWDLMRRACERGLTTFDFGRSKRDTGWFDFKKNWGFEPTPLHYEYQLFKRDQVPQNNPTNPRYQRAIELWRRLPRVVVDTIGPLLSRHLG